ncbi:cell division protein ZapA [Acinetobacter qingfengensis]|uniref:Cell division protein ZapA n=1 Tax=Acinetobacter qingfengensis TaxID=1262585 RepID=A0A1E7R961_9GAMM|nr:cell division protein ZapA [Acinetobacter qingfengensis]KAA8735555.1 cell division protein ZapA [Acinetobacter qingfengensis]OEY95797.1 hypothetical protein BJI46_02410 [Acinetobacter qingfengensis]
MTQNNTVELWLLDNVYKLGCPDESVEKLKSTGKMLEQRFQEFRSANPRMDNQKIAVMIALQLMQEVLDVNKTLQGYQNCEAKLAEINHQLTKQLENLKQ